MEEPRGRPPIKIHFEYDPAYRVVAANSAWVSITTHNDIRVDFTVEGIANPTETTHAVTPDLQIGPEISRTPELGLSRRFQVGVLLSLDAALNIANLLRSQVETHRAAQRQGGTA